MASNHTAPRPLVACEIFADRVLAARAANARNFIETHTSRQLPAGVVTPSLTAANVNDSAVLSAALGDALTAVAGRTRDVVAVLPDAAARVALLDFDSLPENHDEAVGVIRFRLKKSVPFSVDEAAVSFHAIAAGSAVRAVAVVMMRSVLEEYEAGFRRAGYAPGVVLPSTIAALGIVDAEQPSLIIKAGAQFTTLAIVAANELRLFRVLERTTVNGNPEKLAEEIHPSLVFFEDQFQSRIERVLVAGFAFPATVAPALEQQLSIPVEDLVAGRYVSGSLSSENNSGMLAGVAGALLG